MTTLCTNHVIGRPLRRSRVDVIKGGGHPIPVERAVELARLILAFAATSL